MRNKLFICLIISILFLFAIIYYSESVSSFSGTSSSYTVDSKADVVTATNVTSSSFTQRFIGGIQAVARYVSNLFTGRFGVLEDGVTITYIYQCGNLNSANTIYILNNSVNSSGTCFNILANSISLNCNSTLINYSQSANGYAIASNGYNHTNLQNCNITQGSNSRTNSYALYFQNGINSSFSNNKIITYGSTSSSARNYNVFLVNYKNNTLSNSFLFTSGKDTYSVYLSNSGNNTMYQNNISTSGTGSYGVFIFGAGSIANNLTLNNITTYGSTVLGGISLSTNSIHNVIMQNNVTIKGGSSYGLYLLSGSRNNNISWNNINLLNSSSEAIRLHSGARNNSFVGNNISATATGSLGFDLTSNTDENKIINNSVRSNSYALRIISGNNNLIYNNIFNSTTNNLVSMSSTPNFINRLNTTKTLTTNIVGGNNIGGNYWARSSGTGFSQTCQDINLDGICDAVYSINAYNKDYLPLTISDTSAPSINLWSPVNASFVNGIVTLRANASDSSGIVNVTFQYSNSSVSYTIICVDASSPYTCNWNTALFSNDTGGYNIRAVAYDGQNNNANDVKHYTIDRTKPIVYDMIVIYPNGQASVRSGQNITLSATVTDSPDISAGISYVQANLTYLNNTGMVNMTFYSGSKAALQNSTWRLNVSITASTTGIAASGISVFDAATPSHNTQGDLWQVTIDNTAPTYSELSSSNQVYNNTVASFVVSAADTIALDNYIFSQNSSGSWVNDSAISINGTSYYIEHTKIVYTGNFSYRFYIYDDAGNSVQTDIGNIEVFGPAPIPVIYLVSPNNDVITNNATINFTYYYTNAVVDNCTLNLDSISNETMTSPANNTILGFSKGLSDDDHFWFVSCLRIEQDGDTNITAEYSSETRSLNIDTIAPLISIISPENITYNSSSLSFNISINDGISWCGYSLDSSSNITMVSLNETYFYYLYSGISAGSHNIIFSCNDTASNLNATQIRYFSINFPDLIVNITYPINLQDIIRGNDAVAGEDDLGLVANSINITARIYDNETGNNITGVTCHFYDNVTFIGDAYTNSSGHCTMNYTKSSKSTGRNPVSVNYTLLSDITKVINISEINISIIRYVTPVAMTNLRSFGGYFDGDISVLRINITKINESGTFFYNPQNISANATNAAQQPYSGGASYYPNGSTKNITYISQGQFSANQTVNTSFGSFVRWEVTASDNNFASYLGSAVHADKAVCTPSYSDWSSWSACSAGSQTSSRTDGCGGTEVRTQSCSGGGGGGGGGCIPSWSSWSAWGSCINNEERRTRSDGCGDTETEIRPCGCASDWQCGLWSGCVEGTQTRTCTDQNLCGDNSTMPVTSQSCIIGLNVEHTPQELFLNVLSGANINFQITATLTGVAPLEVKWYLDSAFQSGNSGTSSVSSSFSKSFSNNSQIRAEIISGTQSQEVTWQVNVLSKKEIGELGGATCNENWYCKWKPCDVTGYKYSEKCEDLNSCGTNLNKPYKQACSCIPEFKCEDWSECAADYNVKNILAGEPTIKGQQQRTCDDFKLCENNTIETRECNLAVPIKAVKTDYCYEKYIEIKEVESQKLVSRVKESAFQNIKRIDIGFLVTDDFSGFCSYCYDRIKNFDEKETDCGGKYCMACTEKGEFVDYLNYTRIFLWIILSVMFVYLGYRNREQIIELSGEIKRRIIKKPEIIRIKPSRVYVKPRPRISILSRISSALKSIPRPRIEFKLRLRVRKPEVARIREPIISRIRKRIKLFRYRRAFKEREIVPKERVIERIIVERRPRPRIKPLVAELSGKLREWKRKAYYDTSRLERGLAEGIRYRFSEYKKRRNERRVLREKRKTEKMLLRERKVIGRRRFWENRKLLKRKRKAERIKAREERRRGKERIRIERKQERIKKRELRKQKRFKRKQFRAERRIVRKAARVIKKRIRRKEISHKEVPDLEKQLGEWKKKGYYNTARLQRKLDEFKGRNPLK
ncbi:hypothetical protein HYW74_03730 [Candidatus Pacearchaeota archaeon]|nr:hypothetical protein [Candidatus Pacearchaeota archaeon]